MKGRRHEQRKTAQKHRSEDRELKSQPGSLGNASESSGTIGDDAIGFSGVIRKGDDFRVRSFDVGRDSIAGGMLRQLIEEYRDQIEIKLAEVERLRSRVEYFDALLLELEKRLKDNS